MTCENCKVMELLDDFSRRMQRGERPWEALDDAMVQMRLKEKKESEAQFLGNVGDRADTCTITCVEPGCRNVIRYSPSDASVPIYCMKHRTKTGKHAAVRELKRKGAP